jgi:hypothetical protein
MSPDWNLPQPGTSEGQELDFKTKKEVMTDGTANHFEMAKDMAALANAYGGRLIVGAFEDQKVLTVYDKAMTENLAREVCKEYTVAQAQRLEPHVQVHTKVVQTPVGYVGMICVEPSMGQAIGVRVATNEISSEEPKAPPVYAFPIRDGDHTNWMTPENLSMLLIPTLRRNIIILRQAIGNDLLIEQVMTPGGAPQVFTEKLLAIDEDTNTLRLQRNTIAIDQIQSVWRTDQQGWRIKCLP